MSERRLFGLFSGGQLTLILCTALVVPGAVYATVASSPVTITDPTSGYTAAVDAGRKVWVYDTVAGYTKNPAYAVNINDYTDTAAGVHTIYTVPAGKILLIKSVSWADYGNTEGSNSYYYLYVGGTTRIYNTEGLHAANTSTATFEPGLIVRAGALQSYYNGTSGTNTYVQGYLIPASVIPAPTTPAAAEQFVTSGHPVTYGRPQ